MCPWLDNWFANISFHSLGFIFTFLLLSSEAQRVLILMKSYLICFFLCCPNFGVISKNSWWNPKSCRFTPMFLLSCVVLTLTFRSLIYFELIFVCSVREEANLIFFSCEHTVFSASFVEDCSYLVAWSLYFIENQLARGSQIYFWSFKSIHQSTLCQYYTVMDTVGLE